jgi:TIR domain
MYLARLALDDRTLAQGMVFVPGLEDRSDARFAQWRDSYEQLVGNVYAAEAEGASLRAVYHPGVGTTQALVVATADGRSEPLRRFLAPFTRLGTILPESVQLPLTMEQYDAVADDFPPLRCMTAAPGFEAGGAWFACDFRVAPYLETLLREADAYGYRLGYQMNVRPVPPSPDAMRIALRNALAVSQLPGVPSAASDLQTKLGRRLGEMWGICEEYIGVDPGEPERWINTALGRQFRARFGALHFETPVWNLTPGAYADELSCPAPLDPSELDVSDLCSAAVTQNEADELLSWTIPPTLAALIAPIPTGAEPEDEEIPSAPAPTPVAADEPYFFISYKRSDFARIAPIMLDVERRGWRVWYDQGIPGGADWNEMLEQRLISCSGVLLFVTQPAIDSKWVRREARFADSLDKPIIAIQLEPAQMRHGMSLLLDQYQRLNRDASGFLEELERSLSRILPAPVPG